AMAISSVFLIARIELKTDILDVLPASDPRVEPFKEFIQDFGSTDNLIVVLETAPGEVLNYLEMAEELSRSITASDKTEFVDYRVMNSDMGLLVKNYPLFLGQKGLDRLSDRLRKEGVEERIMANKRALLSPFSSPLEIEQIARDPLGLASIVRASILRDMPFGMSGYYTSKDASLLLIFVQPSHNARDLKALGEFREELLGIARTTGKKYGDEVRIGFTGPYAFAMEANASLGSELRSTFAITAVIIFLLFQFIYRKKFIVLVLTGITLFTALSCTLAAAFLLFGGLNIVSSIVATMLIGLGIDYIIHTFNRIEDEFVECGDIRRSIENAFTKVLPGIITGAATTTLAFLSIVLTSFNGLHEMGIAASIGVVSNIVATVFFLSASTVWLAPGLFARRPPSATPYHFVNTIIKQRTIVLLVTLLAVVVSVVLITSIRFDSDPASLGQKDSQARRLADLVSDTLSKSSNPLIVSIEADSGQALLSGYDNLENTIQSLREGGVIGGFSSLSSFLPPPSHQAAAIKRLSQIRRRSEDIEENFLASLERNGFKADGGYISYIKGVVSTLGISEPMGLTALEKEGVHQVRMFYNQEQMKVAAYLYPPNDSNWTKDSMERVSMAVDVLGQGAVLTGAPIMLSSLASGIIRESVTSSSVAFLLIALVIYLKFRRLKWLVLILIPISVGFIFTLGLMRLFSINFNFVNIAAAPLIFGIGVDYGIYAVQGYKEKGIEGLSLTTKSVVMCAFTSIAGFGSLMTMSFEGLSSLGAIITIGIFSSLIVALTLLPSAISIVDGKRKRT
ncbi:MAG: MMPL family transporter, partial [Deltaproteobacteria bacterium]|nr:MMPL family transporter [Deltaproteobacteria bacterium]